MEKIEFSIADIDEVALKFLDTLPSKSSACVVGLSGNLGAGKTTFTQAVARALGITETVTSPTFIIEKIYSIQKLENNFEKLIHIDAYRLERAQELERLGWSSIQTNPKNLIIIEWPEKVQEILPPDTIYISFETKDETTRILTIQNHTH